MYEIARDFLIAICEPVSRPDFIHEYRLDKNALFAAASMGYTSDLVISALRKMSKVPIADGVVEFIRACTSGYGKAKLVLRRGRYYLGSDYPAVLRLLNKHPKIRASRVRYLSDGSRVVGMEAAAPSSSSSSGVIDLSGGAGEDGFLVEHTLAESEGSLGLKGVLGGGGAGDDGSGLVPSGSARGLEGDTHAGTLAGRMQGEVDSDDEDEPGMASSSFSGAGVRAAANSSSYRPITTGAGAGSSSSSSSLPASTPRVAGVSASAAAALICGDGAGASGPHHHAVLERGNPAAAVSTAGSAAGADMLSSMEADWGSLRPDDIAALLQSIEDAEAQFYSSAVSPATGAAADSSPATAAAAAGSAAATGSSNGAASSSSSSSSAAAAPADNDAAVAEEDDDDGPVVRRKPAGPRTVSFYSDAARAGFDAAAAGQAGTRLASTIIKPVLKKVGAGGGSDSGSPAAGDVSTNIAPSKPRVAFKFAGKSGGDSSGADTRGRSSSPSPASSPLAASSSSRPSALHQQQHPPPSSSFASANFTTRSGRQYAAADAAGGAGAGAGGHADDEDEYGQGSDSDFEMDSDAEEADRQAEIDADREDKEAEARSVEKKAARQAKQAASARARRDRWIKEGLPPPEDADEMDVDELAEAMELGILDVDEEEAAEADMIAVREKMSKRAKASKSTEEDDEMKDFASQAKQLALHSLHTPGRFESFEIDSSAVDEVKRLCLHLDPPLPIIQEYDFRHDSMAVPPLLDSTGPGGKPVVLRDASALRDYQTKSLSKMFGNGRARSGMIVLPCGAGKTLVGISACVTVGKSCMVLCPNTTSVNQWVEQFVRFTTIPRELLVTLTSRNKKPLPPRHIGCVLLTTYSMIGSTGRRSKESEALLRDISNREWGVQLLDEVHQAVANTFVRALKMRCHCRLGLTATLVREDGRDRNLAHLIGPKLYEANWMDLTIAGYLANVQVSEVWCPMTPEFYREYLRSSNSVNKKKALAVMNPVKAWAMDFLIRTHEARGDKIIIFSESIFALQLYAKAYGAIVLTGDTPQRERDHFIHAFRSSDDVNKLFLSKVGDVALDVPDANVIIQISSHFGSRLQEAQRMGRILRRGTRANAVSGSQSFFYTLISTDTLEMYFANKRRRYLVDQGYAYKVVPAWPGLAATKDELCASSSLPIMRSQDDRNAVLTQVLVANVDEVEAAEMSAYRDFVGDFEAKRAASDTRLAKTLAAEEEAEGSGVSLPPSRLAGAVSSLPGVTRRSLTSMAGLSGAEGLRYLEFNADVSGSDRLRLAEEAVVAERVAAQRQAVEAARAAADARKVAEAAEMMTASSSSSTAASSLPPPGTTVVAVPGPASSGGFKLKFKTSKPQGEIDRELDK